VKDFLAQLIEPAGDRLEGRNLTREYLQSRILSSLQRAGAMIPLAFHGGTALRFLYQIPRYSEDLDFALERPSEKYDIRAYLQAIRSDLVAENYQVELKVNDRRVVHSGFIRFRGLLNELDLSPHADEVLSIKIEVDTRPPAGAGLETTIVRRHIMLHLQHHDKQSLLAGKLHAFLQRPYSKGRDVYDLFWYLSDPDWPSPNLMLLNNALKQTDWGGPTITESNWREVVREQLEQVNWDKVRTDIGPFLMDQDETELLTRENLLRLLVRA
jgi:predicted nucleotidyltransferase component of viral defense system